MQETVSLESDDVRDHQCDFWQLFPSEGKNAVAKDSSYESQLTEHADCTGVFLTRPNQPGSRSAWRGWHGSGPCAKS